MNDLKFTDYFAVYGAVLSTFVFLWNVMASRSRIVVRLAVAIDGERGHGMMISIQNPSSQTVHVACVSFLYPYREVNIWERVAFIWRYRRLPIRIGWVYSTLQFCGIDCGCPVALSPGQSHLIFVPEKMLLTLEENRIRPILKVEVQDALWRRKLSRNFAYGTITAKRVA